MKLPSGSAVLLPTRAGAAALVMHFAQTTGDFSFAEALMHRLTFKPWTHFTDNSPK